MYYYVYSYYFDKMNNDYKISTKNSIDTKTNTKDVVNIKNLLEYFNDVNIIMDIID